MIDKTSAAYGDTPQNKIAQISDTCNYRTGTTLLFPSMRQSTKTTASPRDYADIIREGVLRVATEYNSISFYVDGIRLQGLIMN
ncbi:hypothetical protein KUBF_14540 [Bacteroides finegoldii]|nr:hypothetical protein KUBF_14540 [Bacteroides finegoldii]